MRRGLGKLTHPTSQSQPTVAVVVAARNESADIGACVGALMRQDYPADKLIILIVDDGSTDGTTEIVRRTAQGFPNLRVIAAPPSPPGVSPKKNALLAGIDATNSEIILTTDADCTPDSGWVAGIVTYFAPEVVAVVGHSPLVEPTTAIARFDSFVNAVVSAGSIGLGQATSAVGRNFAYRRSAFVEIGGFGESVQGASGDDDLLLQRLTRQRGAIRFATAQATIVPAVGATSVAQWVRVKRRHLSAGARYDAKLIALGSMLYGFNLALLVMAGMALAGVIPFWQAGAFWCVKAIADGTTLAKGAVVVGQRNWVGSWLVAELLSPVLFVLLVPVSLLGKVSWKGRELGR